MADAFLSHSHHDREMARRLHDALAEAKKDVWADWEDVPPASRFQRDLDDGVSGCNAFVFLISPDSVSSEYCLAELEKATDLNKRIVPVVHRPVAHDDMPAALAERSWIPLEGCIGDDFDHCLERVVKAIDTDFEWTREHTRWGNHALEWEAAGRDDSLLLRGEELERADCWLASASGRTPAPTALQREYVRRSREYATRSRRVRMGAGAAAVALLLVLGVVTLVIANDKSTKDTKIAYIRSVDSIISGSQKTLGHVQAVFGELDALAKGTNQKISPTDELRRGLDRGLREREASRRRAAALGSPSARAGRMRASLVNVFTLKLPNIRAIRDCLPLVGKGKAARARLGRCLDGTRATSERATNARLAFLPIYNQLQKDAGLAPTKPSF